MPNECIIPARGDDADWMDKFNATKALVQAGNCDLLFIGDSITSHWRDYGLSVWNTYYGSRNALNLGIGGDKTQNILWRLDKYPMNRINPKVAVLLIGTNNIRSGDTPTDVAEGIDAIIVSMKAKMPNTLIVLMGLFPREPQPYRIYRIRANEASGRFSVSANYGNVVYRDIGSNFLRVDGQFKTGMTQDYLHIQEPGYQIWAEQLEPTISPYFS